MPNSRKSPAVASPRPFLLVGLLVGAACGGGEVPSASAFLPPAQEPAPVPTTAEQAPASPAASPAAPPPVDAALPSRLDVPPLRATQTCPAGKHACCFLEPPEGAAPKNAPVALWEVSLEKGACVRRRPESEVEVFGVSLKGSASLRCEEGACPSLEKPYAAFRVPGGGLRLTARSPVRLVIGMARAGGLPLAERKPGQPAPRPSAAPEVFSLAERPDLAWGGGAFHVRIGWEGGPEGVGPPAVLSTLRFSGSAGVAEHEHPGSWECIVVLEGGGVLARRWPGDAARNETLGPGDVVCVAPGEKHAFDGSGSGPFTALQVYAPPGPERRFKDLAAP